MVITPIIELHSSKLPSRQGLGPCTSAFTLRDGDFHGKFDRAVAEATSGPAHAAAQLLPGEGRHEIIITGHSFSLAQQAAAQLAVEIKRQVSTPLDLDKPSSAQTAVAELVKRGRPIDFLLLNAGDDPGEKQVLISAGVEAAQATLSGHHQLTVRLRDSPSN